MSEAHVDQTRSLKSAALNVGAGRKRSITVGQAESQQSACLPVVKLATAGSQYLPSVNAMRVNH
jgi:hypothetical protein